MNQTISLHLVECVFSVFLDYASFTSVWAVTLSEKTQMARHKPLILIMRATTDLLQITLFMYKGALKTRTQKSNV